MLEFKYILDFHPLATSELNLNFISHKNLFHLIFTITFSRSKLVLIIFLIPVIIFLIVYEKKIINNIQR